MISLIFIPVSILKLICTSQCFCKHLDFTLSARYSIWLKKVVQVVFY